MLNPPSRIIIYLLHTSMIKLNRCITVGLKGQKSSKIGKKQGSLQREPSAMLYLWWWAMFCGSTDLASRFVTNGLVKQQNFMKIAPPKLVKCMGNWTMIGLVFPWFLIFHCLKHRLHSRQVTGACCTEVAARQSWTEYSLRVFIGHGQPLQHGEVRDTNLAWVGPVV